MGLVLALSTLIHTSTLLSLYPPPAKLQASFAPMPVTADASVPAVWHALRKRV